MTTSFEVNGVRGPYFSHIADRLLVTGPYRMFDFAGNTKIPFSRHFDLMLLALALAAAAADGMAATSLGSKVVVWHNSGAVTKAIKLVYRFCLTSNGYLVP